MPKGRHTAARQRVKAALVARSFWDACPPVLGLVAHVHLPKGRHTAARQRVKAARQFLGWSPTSFCSGLVAHQFLFRVVPWVLGLQNGLARTAPWEVSCSCILLPVAAVRRLWPP